MDTVELLWSCVKQGLAVNRKTVQRLMGVLGLKSLVRMKKCKSCKGEMGKSAPNIFECDFKVTKPCMKWVADVVEFLLFGQKLYLSLILDLYNGEIISYNVSECLIFRQTMDKLDRAFENIPDGAGLILRSD